MSKMIEAAAAVLPKTLAGKLIAGHGGLPILPIGFGERGDVSKMIEAGSRGFAVAYVTGTRGRPLEIQRHGNEPSLYVYVTSNAATNVECATLCGVTDRAGFVSGGVVTSGTAERNKPSRS